jgi:hypothetical protein
MIAMPMQVTDLLCRLRSMFFSRPGVPPDLPAVNDVARVVTYCNCVASPIGWIGTVSAIREGATVKCLECGFECDCDAAFVPDFIGLQLGGAALTGYFPRHWLRRIPPLSEMEAVDTSNDAPTEQPREVTA